MDELKIVYKDEYPCIYEGMNNYLSVFSLKRKKYFIICILTAVLNLVVLNLDLLIEEYDSFTVISECIILSIIFISTVLYYYLYVKIHLKQISSSQFLPYKDQEKELVIGQNDISFIRKYCKSNYYYDEIFAVIEGKKSISFVIEKNSYPVIISKMKENKKEMSVISSILKEKVGDRYIDRTKGGRK